MKVYAYYLHVDLSDSHILLDKIRELGYAALKYVVRGDNFQVYKIEMAQEDLIVLKLTVPSLQIDEDDGA